MSEQSEKYFDQPYCKPGLEVDGEQPYLPKRVIAEDGSLVEKDSKENTQSPEIRIQQLEEQVDLLARITKILIVAVKNQAYTSENAIDISHLNRALDLANEALGISEERDVKPTDFTM